MTQLYKGSTGADVLALQTKLKDAGYYTGALDSSFGPQTDAALRAFQKAAGIKVDGYYGPQSASALASWKPSATPGTSTATTVLPNTNIDVPKTYNPSAMTGANATAAQGAFNEQMANDNRAISNAMNRRGIYGSTIMEYDIDQNVRDIKTRMDNAWRSAYARGYASNDEAAILGLTPGVRLRPEDKATYGSSSGSASSNPAVNLKVYQTAFDSEFNKARDDVKGGSSYALWPTFDWLTKAHDEGRLSDTDLATILTNSKYLINGRDPLYYYEKYITELEQQARNYNVWNASQANLGGLEAAQAEANRRAQEALAPYKQIVNQETRWGY